MLIPQQSIPPLRRKGPLLMGRRNDASVKWRPNRHPDQSREVWHNGTCLPLPCQHDP